MYLRLRSAAVLACCCLRSHEAADALPQTASADRLTQRNRLIGFLISFHFDGQRGFQCFPFFHLFFPLRRHNAAEVRKLVGSRLAHAHTNTTRCGR